MTDESGSTRPSRTSRAPTCLPPPDVSGQPPRRKRPHSCALSLPDGAASIRSRPALERHCTVLHEFLRPVRAASGLPGPSMSPGRAQQGPRCRFPSAGRCPSAARGRARSEDETTETFARVIAPRFPGTWPIAGIESLSCVTTPGAPCKKSASDAPGAQLEPAAAPPRRRIVRTDGTVKPRRACRRTARRLSGRHPTIRAACCWTGTDVVALASSAACSPRADQRLAAPQLHRD